MFGYKIHKNAQVFSGFFCGGGRGKLYLGKNSFTNYECFFDLGADIIIGENVSVGFRTVFINSSHEIGDNHKRGGKGKALPIIIEDGCWIGANVVIMLGVTIAKGCVIGANSLVTKDTEPNCIYTGQPARKIRELYD